MPDQPNAITISEASLEELTCLESLWTALYEHQREHGMLLTLPPDAFEKWVASISGVLGRFACVFLARGEGEVIGFLAARTRAIPSYFGGGQAGFISEVFVDAHYRSKNIGASLLEVTNAWFQSRGINRLELQVIANNPSAREFYKRHGWRDELLQMVWEKED